MTGIVPKEPVSVPPSEVALSTLVESPTLAEGAIFEPQARRPNTSARPVLEAISRINDLLRPEGTRPLGAGQLFNEIARVSAEAFGYPFVSILLFDEEMRWVDVAGVNNRQINRLAERHGRNSIYRQRVGVDAIGDAAWLKTVLTGQVYATATPAELMAGFTSSVRAWELARQLGVKSGIGVPLTVRGAVTGALMAGSRRAGYEPDEEGDLLLLARHTGVAIEMWRLYDRAEGRTALLRELHLLSRTITGILDLDRLYAEVARAAGQLTDIDFCTVNILTEDRRGYVNHASWGQGTRSEIRLGARSLDLFPPELIRNAFEGKPIIVPDLDEFPEAKERLSHRFARSVAIFPFKSGDLVSGFVTVGRDEAGEWSAADVEVLRQLSDYVTIAFTNARLYTQAKRRAERMATLHTTGEQLARIHEPDLLFEELRKAVQSTVDAPFLQICLWNAEREEIEVVLEVGEADPMVTRRLVGRDDGPARQAIAAGAVYYVAERTTEDEGRRACPELAEGTKDEGRPPTDRREAKDEASAESDTPLSSFVPSASSGQALRLSSGSVLSVPLMSGSRAIGALTVESDKAYAYDEDDVQTLQILAGQAAVTLDNIRLLQAAAQRAAEQTALAESAQAIARLDINTVLQTIVDRASEIVKSSRASLRLYDEETQELYWAAGHNSTDVLKALRIPVGAGIVGNVFLTGRPALVDDLRTHPRSAFGEVDEAEHARAAIAVPLRGPNGNIGVLASTHHEPGVFSERDLQVLSTFADHATIALSNAHLYASLQQREEERTRLLHETLSSQEAERRRVAIDIHDGPLQSIGVNILAVDRVRKLMAAGQIEQGIDELLHIREAMSGTVQELRDVINDLRPVVLERQGLVEAAKAQLISFAEHYGIEAHLENELGEERLPTTVEISLYRLMQEALTNVRKHSAATAVWVKLALKDGAVEMSITDNGVGFDPEAAIDRSLDSGHIGLHSMMERVHVIGGGMEIDSTAGRGSRVTFRAPVG